MTGSIVVTGASGFIGNTLVRFLAEQGRTVAAISRKPCAVPSNVQQTIVSHYADVPVATDSVVIHLAELSSIGEIEKLGAPCINEACERARHLLEKKFERFVYVSSGSVYGTGHQTPRTTSAEVKTDTVYNASKLAVENLVRASGGTVARISNIYGPPLKAGTIFFDVLSQIPGSDPLKVRDTHPARDYLWIGDLVRGLAAIAMGTHSGTFNLGTGISTTAKDIAKTALALAGEPNRIVKSAAVNRHNETDCLVLDSRETELSFGWRAETTLAKGMEILLKEQNG
jgi:nucleoside-diphosphate-sugar epimerase